MGDEETEAARWFCLRSTVKKEHQAAGQIRARVGAEVFAPRIRYTKTTRRGKVRFTEALFPGYLFCRCPLSENLRHLLSLPGVTGVVRYGSDIPSVPAGLIANLRSRLPEELYDHPDPVIEVGSEVRITEGPFRNVDAIVTQVVSSRQRIRVLLEFLGRTTEVEVPLASVHREEDPSAKFLGVEPGEPVVSEEDARSMQNRSGSG